MKRTTSPADAAAAHLAVVVRQRFEAACELQRIVTAGPPVRGVRLRGPFASPVVALGAAVPALSELRHVEAYVATTYPGEPLWPAELCANWSRDLAARTAFRSGNVALGAECSPHGWPVVHVNGRHPNGEGAAFRVGLWPVERQEDEGRLTWDLRLVRDREPGGAEWATLCWKLATAGLAQGCRIEVAEHPWWV